MKTIIKFLISAIVVFGINTNARAQSIDEERMKRDIEVAENVLATLIKQEFQQGTTFFGLDVRGSYQPGYGVTFRVPTDQTMPFVISIGGNHVREVVVEDDNSYRYSIEAEAPPAPKIAEKEISLRDNARAREDARTDSAQANFNERIIKAAQNFIVDYGDFLSQLQPNERIVVTNQGERRHFFPFHPGKRTRISIEGTRADVTAFRQGKLSREQALKKLTVINTETLDAKDPDLEMLSTIFSRLYRPDLSKTYFVEGNVYYERLKDFGTIFYMQMLSSVERGPDRFLMPTTGQEYLDQATRDKKVKELYPAFEKELKENILEYGRTVKSLKGDEQLIFNISLTRCKGCGIPSTLELGIAASVLQDFSAGKISKGAALNKFTVKRGADQ